MRAKRGKAEDGSELWFVWFIGEDEEDAVSATTWAAAYDLAVRRKNGVG